MLGHDDYRGGLFCAPSPPARRCEAVKCFTVLSAHKYYRKGLEKSENARQVGDLGIPTCQCPVACAPGTATPNKGIGGGVWWQNAIIFFPQKGSRPLLLPWGAG